jgi:hypothetical protein
MQCPKCSAANSDSVQICALCGSQLVSGTTAEPKPKREITKRQLLLHVLATLVVFGPLYLLSHVSTVATLATILWLAWRSIGAAREIKKSQFRLARKIIGLVSVIVLDVPIIWILLFKLDAEPIANDYTVADLRSAPQEWATSHELMNALADEDNSLDRAPGIGLSRQDTDVIKGALQALKEGSFIEIGKALTTSRQDLVRAWESAGKGRDIIDKLSTFEQIADLSEPDWMAPLPPLVALRHLTGLYCGYACLQTQMGNSETGVKELITLDLLIRKLCVNARSTVTKLVCLACLSVNIKTAGFIANHPSASETSLELLAAHFTSFTDEQLSCRNQIICEYLTFRNMMKELPFVGRHPAIRHLPFFKRNSTLRMSRNWHNAMLDVREGPGGPKREQLSVWPWIYPDLGAVSMNPDGRLPWHYRRYNRLGCRLLRMGMLAMGRVFSYARRLKVEGDLLQIVLNKRLGREVSLKASAYSDEYIVDIEGKKILSPGPDGQVGTDDDIELPINPSVLQWPD